MGAETKIEVVLRDTNSVTKTAAGASFWGGGPVSHGGRAAPTICIRFINRRHTRERRATFYKPFPTVELR